MRRFWNQVGTLALAGAGFVAPWPAYGQATEGASARAAALGALPRHAAALSLDEVYRLAFERNPMLRAAGAMADATATREASAALPPDPTLQLGVMNFSIPGFATDMASSMAPSIQAMQMVPFPGKLGLSGRIAEQSTEMARAAADERWWEVRTMAAGAFYGIYEIDSQLAVMRETLGLLENFQEVADAMYRAGTGRQSDVLRANVEVSRMEAEIARMEAMRKVTAARLNAVLDRPSGTIVPAVDIPALPANAPDQVTLLAWSEETRPLVNRSRTGVEQARTRQTLARRELWPDFNIGIQYGQRDAGAMGTERMGSAMIGFSVPIFAGRRQLRMREEAAAMESMAGAELAAVRAEVDSRIGQLLADLERARTLITLYRNDVIPQAEASVESSFSSYRVGAVDFMTLVDAQMTANRYEQELYALIADYGRALAELEGTVGRVLPATTELLAEVP
jgi:outer membrane protein, heavy metal efflux system